MYCMLTQKDKSKPALKSNKINSVDNIKKLWTLRLILETKSLRKAAQSAKVSPAAISQTLSSLEKIYQKPLVLRKNNNKIEPTKDALDLVEWMSPVFSALDDLDIKLKKDVPSIDYINLGVTEEFALYYCPRLYKELKAELPQIKLITYSNRSDNLIKMIRAGELCSAMVVADDSTLDSFSSSTIYEDEFGFFINSNLKDKSLEELMEKYGLSTIRTNTTGLPLYMSKFLNQFSPKLKPTFLGDNFNIISKVAMIGETVALLPKRMARGGSLVEIHPKTPFQYSGHHKVSLVSEKYCDKDEVNFIVEKLKTVCKEEVSH